MSPGDLLQPATSAAPKPRSRRPPVVAPVPQWWRDASAAALWAVLVTVTALWVADRGIQDLASLAGALTSTGRITGLIASALLLVQVFLMARVPFFEKAWGQDELARMHRLVGFTSFNLMLAHIVLITLGYAASSPDGLWRTIVDFTLNYPGMLLAISGSVALVMVVLTSLRAARRRLRYESWHLLHLYAYLGAGLALPHQLWTGQEFLRSTVATVFWWSLYAVCAGSVVLFRLALPAWRSLRHSLRVVEVRHESPRVTSVTVTGRDLHLLPAQAGQFFHWRFLDGRGWSRANPYSLSASPDGRTLRITAEHLGDGSARLARLRPGTRVLLEGPYGRMHPGVRTRRKVLLMGAGIGITPMRSLLEGLPQEPGDVTIVYRARSVDDMVLSDEISAVADERGARFLAVVGHRIPGRDTWLPESAAHLTDAQGLLQVVPDVADREVYLCGAPAWMDAARRAALTAGVPASHIHFERFAY